MTRRYLLLLLSGLALVGQQPQTTLPERLGSIEGVVVDSVSGAPIRRATVVAETWGRERLRLTALTDDTGQFAFEQLPSGRVQLTASDPVTDLPEWMGTERVYELSPGSQIQGIRLTLVARGAISGKVVNENKEPVPGCRIQALRNYQQGGEVIRNAWQSAVTSPEGEFRLARINPGSYYLRASCGAPPAPPHGLRPVSKAAEVSDEIYAALAYPGVTNWSEATQIRVLPGLEARGIDFKVSTIHTHTLSVKVLLTGSRDHPGEALFVGLRLRRDSQRVADLERPGSPVDGQTGRFRLMRVPEGSYELVVFASNPTDLQGAVLPVEIGKEDPPDVVVSMPERIDITGRIESDQPMSNEGAHPTAVPVQFEFGQSSRAIQAAISQDGAFVLPNVPVGTRIRLDLSHFAPGQYVHSIDIGGQDLTSPIFTVRAGMSGPLRIRLGAPGGTIKGKALKEPSSTCTVLAIPRESTYTFTTRPLSIPINPETDRYTFTDLPPGRYRLYALEGRASSHLVATSPELLKALESKSVEVEIRKGQTVEQDVPIITTAMMTAAIEQ